MTEQLKIDLSHLTQEEMEVFYKRYLTEKASIVAKDYNLKPSQAKSLFSLLPIDQCQTSCKICGGTELTSKKISKKHFNCDTPVLRIAQCKSCGHKQYISNDLTTTLTEVDSCNCDYCQGMKASAADIDKQKQTDTAELQRKEKSKQIVEAYTIERRFIPFSEATEDYNLSPTVMLMALMFSRWNNIHDRKNEDNFIAPYKDSEILVYPGQANSNSHPLIHCIHNHLVFFDFNRCTVNDFVIEDSGSVSFYSRQLHFQTNFTDAAGEDLSIPQTYEWLYRKFSDGYWYKNWHEQLLDVWLDLGVAECIEYAKSKAEEYNFRFESEVKISEMIRDLLHRHSVSECFYFISTAYWNAAAFLQSNKARSRKHAENTVLGKIMSLANSGKSKIWDRPPNLPRSAFSLMLFDVMLNAKSDAGFYLCPGENHKDLLSRTKVEWPEISDEPISINITGEVGVYDFFGCLPAATFEESDDSIGDQLSNLAWIARVLGLKKAAGAISEKLLNEAKI